MTAVDPKHVHHVTGTQLLDLAKTWDPTEVTVTGFAGSGYSMVTQVLGDQVFVEKDWPKARSGILVVMRQLLTPEQVDFLADAGITDPCRVVADLGIGDAIVIVRD